MTFALPPSLSINVFYSPSFVLSYQYSINHQPTQMGESAYLGGQPTSIIHQVFRMRMTDVAAIGWYP